jgi:hypothetical protein
VKISVDSVAHHRNGIMGNSFHVVLFCSSRLANDLLVGVVFEEKGNVAVLDVDQLSDGDLDFGSNSFRGDDFEADLRAAVKEYEDGRRAKTGGEGSHPHEERPDDVRVSE